MFLLLFGGIPPRNFTLVYNCLDVIFITVAIEQ